MANLKRSPTGCLEWQASCFSDGYGKVWFEGRRWGVHRLVYVLINGPISRADEVLHSCDNSICAEPSHLSKGSHAQNMQEASERKRFKVGENHRSARLTNCEVSVIKKLLALNVRPTRIAQIFEVHYTGIVHMRRGRSWKCV
jgi:hypothetical protein